MVSLAFRMQENTNNAIAINSFINYVKLGICTILALLTTRFALMALGVVDFGLFSVLGSIISFIGVINAIMLSTCNRFIAVAIGEGNTIEINKQFNVNLIIFIGLSILLFVVAYPIGDWYIHRHVNYSGPIENAMMVFTLSIIGAVFSTLAIPYNGLLLAKEKFIVFSSVEVLVQSVKCLVALVLVYHFKDKLFIYACMMAITTVVPVFIYWGYCNHQYKDYVSWNLVTDKRLYRQVFYFSGWVGYGAVACIARNQGSAIIVNSFFNTAMNSALGIANSLNTYVSMFANSLTQPMQPQITKSYVMGDGRRAENLLIMSTKLSFLLMLLISMPFFVESDFILRIWLGSVPAYASAFTILLILDNLVQSFNSGLSTILFASGRIAMYQFLINTLRLSSLFVAYFVLKQGAKPCALFYVYIIFSVICILCTQWCLKIALNYNMKSLCVKSYFPSIIIAILSLLVFLIPHSLHPIVRIFLAIIYVLILDYYFGFDKEERKYITGIVRKHTHQHV